MAEGNFISYFRVSKKQGQELDQQKHAVANFLNGGDWKVLGSYEEKETGKLSGLDNRPQLKAAIEHAKRTGSTLLIAKLDRLSRNVHFISGLMESKVKFVACDMPSANEFTIHVMAAMAEQEAKAISTRTKDRLEYLKRTIEAEGSVVTKNGRQIVSLGNPNNGSAEQTQKATEGRVRAADAVAERVLPIIRKLQADGYTTLVEIASMLTFGKVQTARGNMTWNATQVKRMLDRA